METNFNHSTLDVSPFESGNFEHSNGDETSKTWMVSFADLMAILLTFMVVGFSTSKVEEPVWDGISKSVRTVFAGVQSTDVLLDQELHETQTSQGLAVSYIADLLIDRIPELKAKPAPIEVTAEGVELDMSKLLGNERVISQIVEVLTRIDNNLNVKVKGEEPGAEASDIQRLLVWEQAMSDAALVREALKDEGLLEMPHLSVELTAHSSVGAKIVIAPQGKAGRL